MKLGDLVEKIINIITFGKGKTIATYIANKLGYDDCGCDDRKRKLNEFKINFEWVRSQSYPEPNMNWFVSSTQNITNINYIILARANPKKLINGYKI
jgi:hypothetical protein